MFDSKVGIEIVNYGVNYFTYKQIEERETATRYYMQYCSSTISSRGSASNSSSSNSSSCSISSGSSSSGSSSGSSA